MEEQKKRNPLETEKEGKLIAKFAIPAIISMLVSSLYNIVDQIFIGQGVGLLGNAATNIAFPVSIICTATALLLGIGSASNFNLCSGAGDHEKASRIAGTGLAMLVICGVIIAAVTLVFLNPLLHIFGVTAKILPYSTGLHGDYRIRNTVSNPDDGWESSDPCRQKSDIFDDVYADGSNH